MSGQIFKTLVDYPRGASFANQIADLLKQYPSFVFKSIHSIPIFSISSTDYETFVVLEERSSQVDCAYLRKRVSELERVLDVRNDIVGMLTADKEQLQKDIARLVAEKK